MSASLNPGSWLAALRRIGDSLFALARNRFELFTVEWQEEKLRLLNLLFWLGLAAVIGAAGVFVALFTLAFWLWQVTGYAGPVGLAVVALVIAGAMLWNLRARIRTGPQPFAQTVAEFRKDAACWQGKN
ncbi:MAG TPA: phage holin family protein [Dongiaceae bacterium]|jgi:uncharacterized membrane protein YqjE|nr:phage holin family protein [Dongiaceae bacterium]